MPEYLSPGVYIEETVAGPRPIAGVGTRIAGMVGVTVRGPATGKPVLVTNFLDFQTRFGGFLPTPPPPVTDRWERDAGEGGRWWDFALSVKGFFDNGGTQLYVKRVVSSGAVAGAVSPVPATVTEVTRDAAAGADTLAVRHLIGFTGANPAVTVVRGDDGTEIVTSTVASYSPLGTELTLADALPAEVRASRGDHVRFGPAGPADPPEGGTLTFTAVSPGAWANGTLVRARPVAAATLPLLPAPAEGQIFLTRVAEAADEDSRTVVVAPAAGLAPGEVWVQIGDGGFQATVGDDETLTFAAGTTHPAWPVGTAVRRVRRVNPDDGPLLVGGASRLYPGAVVQLDTGAQLSLHRVTALSGPEVTLDPVPGDVFFETDTLQLVEAEVAVTTADGSTETIGGLRLSDEFASAVATRSGLVRATPGDDLTGTSEAAAYLAALGGTARLLDGGDDGYQELSVADFAGTDGGSGARTGIVALEDIDEIAICAVPGVWSGTVQSALITHCEFMKDRFAVLDPQNDLDIAGIQAFREVYDTSYAALYHPWMFTRHPDTGLDVEIAPSGHVAGIYARTDAERGVHKAPANAVIRGIRARDGLAQDITRRQQDLLNPRNINVLRFFPNQGYRVWGARTLSSDPAWRYVNVRRLFLFLEESIEEGTQWVVFEPNNESLWALVRQTVGNFLTGVWNSGALAGTTPDEAFFVACDRTTMTEDDLLNGRLVCVVGVAPVFPAEFVVFRIQQITQQNL
ncbi:phage tail sheath C-terminal domain-containing protein [Actinoplanes sp. NPDC051851]|uniref:phage tail sheath C-terminal domain-containing protein n=1 Tax=Actinoplanes sp. NPDC051851 TaxID=3154753 RepID=UPI00341293C6